MHLRRTYRDEFGQWQSTNIYPVNDIPKAVIVLNKAYEYVSAVSYPDDNEQE